MKANTITYHLPAMAANMSGQRFDFLQFRSRILVTPCSEATDRRRRTMAAQHIAASAIENGLEIYALSAGPLPHSFTVSLN